MKRLLTPTALLVAGAVAWPAIVGAADPGQPLGPSGWLLAASLALALAGPLVRLARRVARDWDHRVLEGSLLALAAGASTALALTVAEAIAGHGARAVPVELARELALAMFAAAPLGLLVARAHSEAAEAAALERAEIVPAPRKGSTRRGFLKVGGASVAGAALVRYAPAAAAAPRTFVLTITDGDIHMIDDTPVFHRGFGGQTGHMTVPGPVLGNPGPFETGPEIVEGKTVHVVLVNLTPRAHTFLIERTDNEAPTDPVVGPITIPPGGIPVDVQFTAPSAGTYIYRDADRNNRLLGMHGAMVVMPSDGSNRPYRPAPDRLEIPAEFLAQYTWMLHDIDPLLGELARANPTVSNLDYSIDQLVPRYFTINGVSGVTSTENLLTIPVFPVQDTTSAQVGALIRVVNTGCASHSPHWHGNHVFVVERNAQPAAPGFIFEKDVVRMAPLQRISVLLPVHPGLDAWPPLDPVAGFEEQGYPMHCHAEMSQTAAGGLYPMGMLADWRLVAKPQDVAAAKASVASGAKTRAAKAEIARVIGRR